ncbi:MAG: DeoR family transcriptional regulator [Chloroflexi bacterium]|nr:DeoR family transcriptional regulator [Chloroflexota bacterium]
MNLEEYLGETNLYDKKEALERSKPKSWLKTISAFANSRGGKLIFGVKEDNTIVGINDYQGDTEFISEVIKTKIDPIPEFDVEIITIEEKFILVLTVFAGRNTPYFLVDSGSRIAYKRIGNQSVTASRIDLVNLSLKGQKRSFDSLPLEKCLEDVSFRELRLDYRDRVGKPFEESDFKSFGLVDEEGVLTIAGALFADGHQVYQSRVFCTRWNGLDKTHGLMEALDDKEFEGNLLYLLNASLDFVKRNSKKMWKKGPVYRIEYPEYPERAVQEAIVNALIHRDYTVIGSEVHIDIYDDRLEVYSPGGMYDGTFIQDLDPFDIASTRRNPVIADLFARMNLMERRGSGLKNIIETYESEENYKEKFKPEFRSTETSFFTVLKNLNYDTQSDTQNDTQSDTQSDTQNVGQSDGQNEGQNEGQKLKPAERRNKILEVIKQNAKTTALDLAELFSVSRSTIKRDLAKLTQAGYIKYSGSSKDGQWEVKNK